mmetsp:Transcript_15020/g.41800  ORF Transcript_15020/g.41800 Transcript_15020/m.41800 type:complete len:256 (-) Transcript_15020:241-1008(-)
MNVSLYFFKELIVGGSHQIARNRSLGLRKPPFESFLLGGRDVWLRLHHHAVAHAHAHAHHARLLHHSATGILSVLGGVKGNVVRLEKGIQRCASLELRVNGRPTQKALQFPAADLQKGRVEASHGLLLGQGRDNGARPFRLEAFVEPEKVAVTTEDRREGLGAGHFAVGWPDVDAVRGVLVHALGVLDGIRDRDVACCILGFGTTCHSALRILWESNSIDHDFACCLVRFYLQKIILLLRYEYRKVCSCFSQKCS